MTANVKKHTENQYLRNSFPLFFCHFKDAGGIGNTKLLFLILFYMQFLFHFYMFYI